MRLIIDSLIALMLLCILAAVFAHYHQDYRREQDLQFMRQSLASLQEQALYHRVLEEDAMKAELAPDDAAKDYGKNGFLRHVKPQWFEQPFPVNVLVPMDQPWIDVAPPGDMQNHPPDPLIYGPGQAGFWYNPNRGIFRARIMPQLSEADTLQLYNQVNGTMLLSLPTRGNTAYEPQPNPLVPEPTVRHAAHEAATTTVDRIIDTMRGTADALVTAGPATARAAQVEVANTETGAPAVRTERSSAEPASEEPSDNVTTPNHGNDDAADDTANDAADDTPDKANTTEQPDRPTLLSKPKRQRTESEE